MHLKNDYQNLLMRVNFGCQKEVKRKRKQMKPITTKGQKMHFFEFFEEVTNKFKKMSKNGTYKRRCATSEAGQQWTGMRKTQKVPFKSEIPVNFSYNCCNS